MFFKLRKCHRSSQIFQKALALKKTTAMERGVLTSPYSAEIRLICKGQSPICDKMLFFTADVLQTTQMTRIFADFFLIPSEYADFSQAQFFLQRTFLVHLFRFSELALALKPGYWLLQKLVPST